MDNMYQVHVTTVKNENKPVGPKFSTKEPAEQLAYTMRMAAAQGRLHGWNDARVVTLIPEVQ